MLSLFIKKYLQTPEIRPDQSVGENNESDKNDFESQNNATAENAETATTENAELATELSETNISHLKLTENVPSPELMKNSSVRENYDKKYEKNKTKKKWELIYLDAAS